MKKLIVALALMLPMFAYADDSYNKGMKVECLKAAKGPILERGKELIINPAQRVERKEKTTVMASKMSATMFTGKTIIGGWNPHRTDIDGGEAVYINRGNERLIMVISKDAEAAITVLLPDNTMIEALNCNITWLEN